MNFPTKLEQLCTPAALYFVISVVALIIVMLQNIGNTTRYDLGTFSCNVPSTVLVFIVKLIYILFWTWILNLICKDGYKGVSWVLVLLPFLLLFVVIGLIMLNQI
jgi:hypothetical protein